MPTFALVLLAGISMATYTIFLRLASPGIHPVLGATIITGVALAVNGSVALGLHASGAPIAVTLQSVLLRLVVGAAAAGADLFMLSAYASGLRITSSFAIGGTAAVLVLLVGFLVLKEPFTWTKLLAVVLVAAGIFLMQREGL